jgi:hypothetical protein
MKKQLHQNHSIFVKYKFISLLALLTGGLIYILLRPAKASFIQLFGFIGADHLITSIRQDSLYILPMLPEWVVFSLPNGLWAFAYSLLISGIWSKSKSYLKYLWLISVPLLVLGFEFLQYFEIIRGTFCLQDIAFGAAGIIIGFIAGIRLTKITNYEREMV